MPEDRPPAPPPIPALLAAAGERLAARDYRAAHAMCLDILKAAPRTAEAWYLLGVIAADHDDAAKAIELLDRAIVLRPGFAQALAHKARTLMAAGKGAEAVEAAALAEAARPRDAYTLDTIGVVYTRAGLHERAVPLYARASAGEDQPGYHYNHWAALQFLGRFDEARVAYRACLKRDPRHGLAWSALVQITRQTPEANEVAALTPLAEAARDPVAVHTLGHALAKAHEDLGQHAQSMAWLGRAKALGRKSYNPSADMALFDAAEQSLAMPKPGGLKEARPIFVLGMPRTGTTLVDRILSSHSEVASAGERLDFPAAVKRAAGVVSRHMIDAAAIAGAASADPAAIGRDYMAAVKGAQGLAGRFVDKLPLNFFLAPHIVRALPDARVICLRRHPADVVLSNYRQAFAEGFAHFEYGFDLEATARYYVRFDRLMQRYAGVLPPHQYCEVSYEGIVANLEGETRRLLDFCGLGFEAACLNFQDNPAPVATASAAQVRQPLYASSIGRWKKYRPALDAALAILVEGGCLPADALE